MKFIIHNSKFIFLAVLLLSSCSTKPCRCYLLEKWGSVVVSTSYIDKETPCSELSYHRPNPEDSTYRHCTEIDSAEIDPSDIEAIVTGRKW
ncbi:MAG: hypothetical protein J6Y98_03730 [Bacteroidales bacterium]|nr:hypothetical protein [Bacteroidales bacterium]